MTDEPVGTDETRPTEAAGPADDAAGAGGAADERDDRWLQALDLLLTEQRFRIGQYTAAHAVPACPTEPSEADRRRRASAPAAPVTVPEPPVRQLLDALPLAAMVVLPALDERGAIAEFCYVGHNVTARRYAESHFPPGALPPHTRAVPLFDRFPNLADTPVPRMLAEAHRTGRPQGPESAEWSLSGPDGRAVRLSSEVRVAPFGDLLLVTWERGEQAGARMAEAAQNLARVCWAEWNLGDGTVEATGLDRVLGLEPSDPLPDLLELGRMLAPDSRRALYQAVHDVLLREREIVDLELRMTSPHERILRFIAEPVRPRLGPVWTMRAVCRDVTSDVRSRTLAEQAMQEARAQRERADAVADVAERLRDAIVPRFPAELGRHGVEAAAVYRPEGRAARVGGDWYKTRVLPSGQVLIALGDARGHGLDAITLMAKLRYALAGLAFTGEAVERLTGWLNVVACDDGEESTATAIVARYHPDRALLRWTCAGHPLPILIRDREARLLDPPPGGPGMPLGVWPEAAYTAAETLLHPGDVVLLYSDGLIERRGSDLDRDSSRLVRAVHDTAREGIPPGGEALDAYIRRLVDRLTGPHMQDDATILAFRLVGRDIVGW
ncbi:PP2C family protein-serine/threonine phosphatase [Streptomyces sp. NPDC007070]|uniref:PP2C family protein-serine/threonine phosphatase n=1 Tax=Streptomyces sp. NPDC007070 TaxID=3154312 RepID=UPI0033E79743